MSNPIRPNPQRPSPNPSTTICAKPPSLKNLSEKFSTAVSISSSRTSLDSDAPKNATEFNWQEKKTTLKARFSHLFNNETLADVHFIVGNEEMRIPAHKLVLSAGSAVFDAMFNGDMRHTEAEVIITDIESPAFLVLLRFLYSDESDIGPENVMTTLYTAKKYAVPALENQCIQFLETNLTSENAFLLLSQARMFSEDSLAERCLECIDQSTDEALAGDSFVDIDFETLLVILKRDSLGIREHRLFSAILRWAGAECGRVNLSRDAKNMRKVLEGAIELVRFPLMTIEEFAAGPAQSDVLEKEEVVDIFLHFAAPNPKPTIPYPDHARCCHTGKEEVVSRFSEYASRWGYSGTCDRIRFTVSRKIYVVGLGLYGSIHSGTSTEYRVMMQIIHSETNNICGQNETSFSPDGTPKSFRVMFKEPIEIKPNQFYTASATLNGPDSWYGTKGLAQVQHVGVGEKKTTFTFFYAACNNNGTSVEDGQIPELIFFHSIDSKE
ncbi:unnamed protein product [Oikopleura dioica]|uniref:BTB domain-containing protein n=1 Tax=Oikopleura dioica TaxID=34765 RepID=E4XD73_OIKDI|nr:unnamed protein product [Oikopleura dioica]